MSDEEDEVERILSDEREILEQAIEELGIGCNVKLSPTEAVLVASEIRRLRARVEELETLIRKHREEVMDDCVMTESDPCHADLELWKHVEVVAEAAF
jgi:hypothetical protein